MVIRAVSGGPLFNYSLDFAGGNSTTVALADGAAVTEDDKSAAESVTKEVTGELPEISVSDNTKLVVRTNELSEDEDAVGESF